MFNDALGDEWWATIKAFGFDNILRQQVFTARFGQAMARVSHGIAYFAGGFGTSAYTIPNSNNPPNVWRTYEFPELQKNPLVSYVVRANPQGNRPFPTIVDYDPTIPSNPRLPYTDADTLPVPL